MLLIDSKKRRYLVTLIEGGEFHSHAGFVPHADIVGQPEGVMVRSTRGQGYRVVRPTLADFVLKMPRGAQVIYPKDLGPILVLADISPGVRVLESGVGSGALSMTMVRAGAVVTGYELRDDFADRAADQRGVVPGRRRRSSGTRSRSATATTASTPGVDRIVLDLPEPWQVVPHARGALEPGGILVAYTPSITQATQLRDALDDSGFAMAETLEVLQRTWHIEGQAVRPDHRMVAHTGFLTHARLIGR